ncbi:MAG: hypothetical protein RL511_1759 [Bacteroidota bacterium]|jgi:hypothetical protein
MLEEIIKSAFTIVSVIIGLSLLKKEMSKKVEPLTDGSFELRVSRIYFFTGAVCACIFSNQNKGLVEFKPYPSQFIDPENNDKNRK